MSRAEAERRLPLSPLTFHVLVALAREPMHGYAVIQEVARASRGTVTPGAGTFYSAIARMHENGLLEEVATDHEHTAPGKPKRTFRVTEFGLEVMRAERERLQRLVDDAEAADRAAQTAGG